MFDHASVSVSKKKSSHPQYFDKASLFFELLNSSQFTSDTRERSKIYVTIRETIHQILRDCDYHLIVRLKYTGIIAYCHTAAAVGYWPVIDLMIRRKGCNINDIFYGACEGGYLQLLETMYPLVMRKGVQITQEFKLNWENAFYHAGMSGNIEIIEMLCGKLNIIPPRKLMRQPLLSDVELKYINCVLCGACRGGHVKLAKRAIVKGSPDIGEAFGEACEGGHLRVVEMLMDKVDFGDPNVVDLSCIKDGLCKAGEKGYIDIINHFHDKIGIDKHNWDYILEAGCKGNNSAITDLAINNGATVCSHCNKSIKEHTKPCKNILS